MLFTGLDKTGIITHYACHRHSTRPPPWLGAPWPVHRCMHRMQMEFLCFCHIASKLHNFYWYRRFVCCVAVPDAIGGYISCCSQASCSVHSLHSLPCRCCMSSSKLFMVAHSQCSCPVQLISDVSLCNEQCKRTAYSACVLCWNM